MPFWAEAFSYISTYGYLAVFIGGLFEGETWLVLAGLFAQQGHLYFVGVLVAAWLGAMIGDLLWFLMGRYKFPKFIHSRPWFQRLSAKPVSLIGKSPEMLAFSMHFLYGFRTLIPLGLGMSNVPLRTYITYNAAGAVVWVLLFGSIGYFFGELLEIIFGRIKKIELLLVAAAILLSILLLTGMGLLRRKLFSKLEQEQGSDPK